MKRVTFITPAHISCNPRLFKEANTLHSAGFQVRVVAGDYSPEARILDNSISPEPPWSWVKVPLGSKPIYLATRFLQKLAQKLAAHKYILNLSIATFSNSPISYQLAKAAAAEPADLYIAHCLAALPAAVMAAEKHHGKVGFDAEDFHIGELPDTPENQAEIAVRDVIERSLLPRCDYLTAASPLIAEAYRQRYGVEMTTILNVFPLSEAPPSLNQNQKINSPPSLYWFSQTIGSGRGIESIVLAMGKMQTPVNLYLRGYPARGYLDGLMDLAQSVGVGERLHILPSAPPGDMAKLAANYDLGLSLEITEPQNRAICLTNKIFTYLLAGIPVLLSHTPAQSQLAEQLGEAAILVDIHDTLSLASILDHWFTDAVRMENARAKARQLGQEVYNWDVEQCKFLGMIRNTFM